IRRHCYGLRSRRRQPGHGSRLAGAPTVAGEILASAGDKNRLVTGIGGLPMVTDHPLVEPKTMNQQRVFSTVIIVTLNGELLVSFFAASRRRSRSTALAVLRGTLPPPVL